MKYRFLFPSRVRAHRDLDIFLGMMDEVIAHKRQILNNQQSKVPESERDLLTLMIEAENSGEGSMTNEELRVSFLDHYAMCDITYSYCSHRVICVSSSLLDMTPQQML